MIRRLRAMWANLRSAPLVTDAPATDTGSLDELDGMGPVGEIPHLTDEQVNRLWADLFPGVPFPDWHEHADNTLSDLDKEWDR